VPRAQLTFFMTTFMIPCKNWSRSKLNYPNRRCVRQLLFLSIWSEHPNIDMHTNPCANMETHWPVHLKRDPRPTHFEREAGPYALSVLRPIRSEHPSAEICWHAPSVQMYTIGRTLEREYMTESCPRSSVASWLSEIVGSVIKASFGCETHILCICFESWNGASFRAFLRTPSADAAG